MIKEIIINNTDELIKKLNTLENSYIFRGHANRNWKIESTIERMLNNDFSAKRVEKFENYSLELFQSKYHIYNEIDHVPDSKLSWLSAMQHYGVPTRLVDFTASPYIALYFAFESYNPFSTDEMAIYAIDYSSLMEKSMDYIARHNSNFQFSANNQLTGKEKDTIFEDTIDPHLYDVLWVTEPLECNARIDRQAGTFLISGNKGKKPEELLNAPLYDDTVMHKYVIPNDMYKNIYALLRKMNINSKIIYGDLGGLAKAIKMDIQIYALP